MKIIEFIKDAAVILGIAMILAMFLSTAAGDARADEPAPEYPSCGLPPAINAICMVRKYGQTGNRVLLQCTTRDGTQYTIIHEQEDV